MRKLITYIILLWYNYCVLCSGQTDVQIIKPGAHKSHINISSLNAKDEAGWLFRETLEEDLKLSGWFIISPSATITLTGEVLTEQNKINVTCSVFDTARAIRLLNKTGSSSPDRVRHLAHEFADAIVSAVKRVPGIATTKIVMIRAFRGQRNLYICDYDGRNLTKITQDNVLCYNPSWRPDGRGIVYVSYISGYPDLYFINLDNLTRTRLSSFPGLNAGGAFSPDGHKIAVILSKDGTVDLYTMNADGTGLFRITKSRAVEASPSWSPDGKNLAFVSDKTGIKHIYAIHAEGGTERRLTLRGSENVSPDWGPDGRIVYSSRRSGRLHIYVMNPETDTDGIQITSDNADYEDPSWAPDGRHIVCSRTAGYRSEIYVIDTMGDPPRKLVSLEGDWYSPAWSPKK